MTQAAAPASSAMPAQPSGPLAGLRVVEFAGLGPAPFAGMLLADLGAQVLRIDRLGPPSAGAALFDPEHDILQRGRQAVALNLKHPAGCAAALQLIASADALIEGFRPGVMERLGLGPEPCLAANPKLVYGRMTGWGQSGPLAQRAGHDINYLALSGALHAIGRADGGPGGGPVPPLNLVADFGGGAMLLAVGLLAALLEVRQSGQGQVVDAAMTDGCALLMAMTLSLQAMGRWQEQRQSNLLDGGAPHYDTYACADGRHLAIGPLEPAFYRQFLQGLGLADEPLLQEPNNQRLWPAQKARLAQAIAQRSRDEWMQIFEGSDACVAPVLTLAEAAQHPHHLARQTYLPAENSPAENAASGVSGFTQPAPAPRFSRTPAAAPRPLPSEGQGSASLRAWGWEEQEIARLAEAGLMR